MPIFWTEEERVAKSGDRLPYMEVHVGSLVLRFNGRPGARLAEAVDHLRAMEGIDMAKVRGPQGPKVRGPQKPKPRKGPKR